VLVLAWIFSLILIGIKKEEKHIGCRLYNKVKAMGEEFAKVAETKDIKPSQMKAVEVDGESICLANIDGKYYGIGNICTHVGGPLDQGTVEGYEVECPWHGSKFDVRTGEPTKPPARSSEPTYEVKVEGESILIRKRK
jgi:nitrite reductase/ring-hydroxylating ferredoxin subunit